MADIDERWRPVRYYSGLYEVSNLGRVRSVARWVACGDGRRLIEGRILKPKIGDGAYPEITLCNGADQRPTQIHRLVADAFIAGYGQVVRHLDGDSSNPRSDNLAWGSYKENEADKRSHGTVPIGEKHPNAKATDDAVRAIRAMHARGLSQLAIAKETGINRGTVGCIVRGERWTHVI